MEVEIALQAGKDGTFCLVYDDETITLAEVIEELQYRVNEYTEQGKD